MTPGKIGKYLLTALLLACTAYYATAYLAMPAYWTRYEKHHPGFVTSGTRCYTKQGVPGDPINIAFVGSERDLHRAMAAAGWLPADPITLSSSLRIVADSLLHREYAQAPVSDLYLWHKKQDLAFQQPFGKDPRQRHHVRFWRSNETDENGDPLWLGAATFDTSAGISHLTGQITHHIDADVDRERDKLVRDLAHVQGIEVAWAERFQDALRGKNGGGDPFFTDGRLAALTAHHTRFTPSFGGPGMPELGLFKRLRELLPFSGTFQSNPTTPATQPSAAEPHATNPPSPSPASCDDEIRHPLASPAPVDAGNACMRGSF